MEPVEFVEKHVIISMNNGTVLEGFITQMEADFLTLIEFDNSKVLVRIEQISFIRLKQPFVDIVNVPPGVSPVNLNAPGVSPINLNTPNVSAVKVRKNQTEFSMPINPEVGNDSYVKHTEFVRETPRKNS